jgi:hypothetical protein
MRDHVPIKASFLTEPKTKLAIAKGGDAVVTLWLALKIYVHQKGTGGFFGRDVVDHLPGAPRKARHALQALIECGDPRPDGSRGAGLVDVVEHGYRLHEYEDHEPLLGDAPLDDAWADEPVFSPPPRALPPAPARRVLTPAELEARRRGGLARSLAGRSASGHLTSSRPAAAAGGDQQRLLEATSSGDQQSQQRPAGGEPSDHARRGDLESLSSENSSNLQAAATALTGTQGNQQRQQLQQAAGGPAKPAAAPAAPALIPCPADLQLTPDQVGTLLTALIPDYAIKATTARFVAGAVADPDDRRSLVNWRKSLSAAVSGDWNNPNRRPQPPDAAPSAGRKTTLGGRSEHWPTDEDLRLREAIRSGHHGEVLKRKLELGQLDHESAKKELRNARDEARDKEQRHRDRRATGPVPVGDLLPRPKTGAA